MHITTDRHRGRTIYTLRDNRRPIGTFHTWAAAVETLAAIRAQSAGR